LVVLAVLTMIVVTYLTFALYPPEAKLGDALQLVFNLASTLGTGGAVIAAIYISREERRHSRELEERRARIAAASVAGQVSQAAEEVQHLAAWAIFCEPTKDGVYELGMHLNHQLAKSIYRFDQEALLRLEGADDFLALRLAAATSLLQSVSANATEDGIAELIGSAATRKITLKQWAAGLNRAQELLQAADARCISLTGLDELLPKIQQEDYSLPPYY